MNDIKKILGLIGLGLIILIIVSLVKLSKANQVTKSVFYASWYGATIGSFLMLTLFFMKFSNPKVGYIFIAAIFIIFLIAFNQLFYVKENFDDIPQGLCFNNSTNKYEDSYGTQCGENKGQNILDKIDETNKKCKKELSNLENELTTLNAQPPVNVGLCEYIDNNTNKKRMGYLMPEFPGMCLSEDEYKKIISKRTKENFVYKNKNFITKSNCAKIIPSNLTKCVSNTKDPNEICRNTYGEGFGMIKKYKTTCPEGEERVMCGKGYEYGFPIRSDETSCAPMGTDMNYECNKKLLNKKDSIALNYGWETLNSKSCPDGQIRAKCNSNYYDGKMVYGFATDCLKENTANWDSECKKKYGNQFSNSNVGAYGCRPGYLRGLCQSTIV